MKLSTSSHPLARLELIEAARYYEEMSPGLGREFLESFEATLQLIRENPESAMLVSEAVRRKLIRRFPFSIYYQLLNDEAKIIAIAHQGRRPMYWLGRT